MKRNMPTNNDLKMSTFDKKTRSTFTLSSYFSLDHIAYIEWSTSRTDFRGKARPLGLVVRMPASQAGGRGLDFRASNFFGAVRFSNFFMYHTKWFFRFVFMFFGSATFSE